MKAAITCLLLLLAPAAARGQSVELYGAGGPTISDSGHSVAAGAGFSPGPGMTLVFGFERTHLASQTSRDPIGRVVSSFRGGTLLLGTAELRYAPLGRDRLGPFVVGGLAAGTSRPNVTASFPDRVTNRAGAMFVGGGLQVPVGAHLVAFVDLRMMVGAEGTEGVLGVAPLRGGLAWRF